MQDIEDDGFITIYPSKVTGYKVVKYPTSYFDEVYEYKGFVLVNDIIEDDDCLKNYYQWGQFVNGVVVNPVELEGLSSRSYARWDEVWNVFTSTVENILKKMQNNG